MNVNIAQIANWKLQFIIIIKSIEFDLIALH